LVTRTIRNHRNAPEPVIVEELLTVGEVARQLRVDDTTVRRWIKGDMLDVVILPHTGKRAAYRVPKSALEKLLNGSSLLARQER
jgi:excisionase family DNA binding protein